jgi:hypothetical protein
MALFNPGERIDRRCTQGGCFGDLTAIREDPQIGHAGDPVLTQRVHLVKCQVCGEHYLYNSNTGILSVTTKR